MQNNDRKIGIPYFSFYTMHFKEFFELLGLEVINPIKINEETTKLGVKHSVEMFCFPFKIILGNSIQLIEKGANTIVMFNTCGKCKLRHYHKLINLKLHQLGYRFEMIDIKPYDLTPIPFPSFMNKLVYLSGKSKWEISRIIRKKWMDVKEEENKRYCKEFGRTNIVITGEIYSTLEEGVNHNIEQQLENLGVTVHSTLNVRNVITEFFYKTKKKRILKRKALSFLDKDDPGGHGLHSIEDCLYWSEKEIDGIIHIMPLTCHPEILVEEIVDYVCKENKTPLLKIKIDETSSPLNTATRLETFVELIKRKKEGSMRNL